METSGKYICFNSFDEEMKYLEECIGKDESGKDSVSTDRKMEVFPRNDKIRDELL